MCGIVGYIGPRNAAQIIMDGLQRLEYRGYDSAGIAVIENGGIAIRRDVGKLSNLSARLAESPFAATLASDTLAGPRTASRSERNAHPHVTPPASSSSSRTVSSRTSCELARRAGAEGIRLPSETDTEVIVHLIGRTCSKGVASWRTAVRQALAPAARPERHRRAVRNGSRTR